MALPVQPRDEDYNAENFVGFAHKEGVLMFGEYELKSGRQSPYFFNAGLFDDGIGLLHLANFYATSIINSGIKFDMMFGPAYKGIPLVAVVAVELARRGYNVPYTYNRKEEKDHGEKGVLVGAPMKGNRVLITDDVISAGTAVRESIKIIEAAKGIPCALAIALDRQEKAVENGVDVERSAVQYAEQELGLQVCSVAKLTDLMEYLKPEPGANNPHYERMLAYRARYGVG